MPLIRTEGMPSAACNRLLTSIAATGAQIRWRGDFDWTGLRTTASTIDRYDAEPWRMSTADYETALAPPESPSPCAAPPHQPLGPRPGRTDARAGRAVMKEQLVPLLRTQ